MQLFVISLLVTLASTQTFPGVDQDLLNQIFGPPAINTISTNLSTTGTEVKTIEVPPKNIQEERNCQCVPQNLCNTNLYGVDVNNPAYTGVGVLDLRAGVIEECPLPGEVCCEIPPPKPMPDYKNVKSCGHRNINGIGPNVAGASTQFGEFPWVVALFDANSSYIGVGALIHAEIVMTVAHIATKYTSGGLTVRAGEWDLRNTDEKYYHEDKRVTDIFVHEKFNRKSFANDIALLRLEYPFKLTEHINTICLTSENSWPKDNYIANGWGKDTFGLRGKFSSILKKVELQAIPNDQCNSLLKKTRLGPKYILDKSFLCATGENGEDMCQGDGGGPLVSQGPGDIHQLYGLVSYGIGCGQKNIPAVYTNVAIFYNWVLDKMAFWNISFTKIEL